MLLVLGACSDDRALVWEYSLPEGVEVAGLEGRIREGGCDGRPLYEVRFRPGEPISTSPPGLPPGEFGFEVLARDSSCTQVATGCEEAGLPSEEGLIRIELSANPGAGCAMCDRGLCAAPADAGVDAEADVSGVDGGACDCTCAGDECVGGRCVPETPIDIVRAASTSTCAIGGGRLWCWGTNTIGQVGSGSFDGVVSSPRPLGVGFEDVSLGVNSSSAVQRDADGPRVLGWGSNNRSQLGLGAEGATDVSTPVPQPMDVGLLHVAQGSEFALGVNDAGELFGWGTNAHGSLTTEVAPGETVFDPVRVGLDVGGPVVQVAAGTWTGFALREDGRLFSWGWSRQGQQGTGLVGSSSPTPAEVGGGPYAEVSHAQRHGCARRRDGTVWCWGQGSAGAAQFFQCDDVRGALGVGEVDSSIPMQVVGLDAATDVTQALSAYCSTCVIDSEHRLQCFGANAHGELGVGDQEVRDTPAEVAGGLRWRFVDTGAQHTCAITDEGALYCWGDNARRVLGDSSLSGEVHPTPQRVCLP